MTYTPERCPVQGKVRYATRTGAFAVAVQMFRRNKRSVVKQGPCTVYRCRSCSAFHVGHKDFRKGKGK